MGSIPSTTRQRADSKEICALKRKIFFQPTFVHRKTWLWVIWFSYIFPFLKKCILFALKLCKKNEGESESAESDFFPFCANIIAHGRKFLFYQSSFLQVRKTGMKSFWDMANGNRVLKGKLSTLPNPTTASLSRHHQQYSSATSIY